MQTEISIFCIEISCICYCDLKDYRTVFIDIAIQLEKLLLHFLKIYVTDTGCSNTETCFLITYCNGIIYLDVCSKHIFGIFK